MGYTGAFSDPLYEGLAAPSAEVPGRFHVGLQGRGFMLDLASQAYRRESIPLLREQADNSATPTESSTNPNDLWRRTMTSWHLGSGQRNYDRVAPPAERFFASKGIDPWTDGQFGLLPDTTEFHTSANTNLHLAVAGDYLYFTDGASLKYTQNLSSKTDITGEPATGANGLTSDGYSVYSSHAADGLFVTTRGASSTAKGLDETVDGVAWVKGRLFAWEDKHLYNVILLDTGTPKAWSDQASVLDHYNPDWTWVDIAEAGDFYFFAGYSGDKALIYRSAVKDDGTGLDVAEVAGQLPDGELVNSIEGYLGFLLVGTSMGVRFAVVDADGALTLGGLIDIGKPVHCFEGQDRFVWFGWSQFDATSTGLGRMDLSVFNDTRPAYASDLMASENGDVTAVVTFDDRRVFAVAGDGIFAEDSDLVPMGTLETGRISYGLYDPKVSYLLVVDHTPLAGSISAELAKDGGDFVSIGAVNTVEGATRTDFPTNRARGEHFDLRLTLTRSLDDPAFGPTVGRITFRSKPAAARSEQITVPLLLGMEQNDRANSRYGRKPSDDLVFLQSLEDSGDSFAYQEGGQTLTVVAEDHTWVPHHLEDNGREWAGTYLIILKRFATE